MVVADEERLKEQRRALPDAPGVYLFRDEKRRVLYVGKARSIRSRVNGHFSRPRAGMVDHVRDIEFIVTETEAEALLAEQEFIKRHRPVYNVRLRDDKSYPYKERLELYRAKKAYREDVAAEVGNRLGKEPPPDAEPAAPLQTND